MNRDLAVVNNSLYKQAKSDLAEARRIDKQIKELEFLKAEKLKLAQEKALQALDIKIRELNKQKDFCKKKIKYFELEIEGLQRCLAKETNKKELNIIKYHLKVNQDRLVLWKQQKKDIQEILLNICKLVGHTIDKDEEPIIEEGLNLNNIPMFYIKKRCICCGNLIEISLNPGIIRENRNFDINTKLPIKLLNRDVMLIEEEEKEVIPSNVTLGRTRVILNTEGEINE